MPITRRSSRWLPLLGAVLASAAACSMPVAGPGSGAPPAARADAAPALPPLSLPDLPRTSDPEVVVPSLRLVFDAADGAAAAWPGFDLREQVIVASFLPAGPTYRLGDPDPPAGYRMLDPTAAISVRDGADSPPGAAVPAAADRRRSTSPTTLIYLTGEESAEEVRHRLLTAAFRTHQRWVHARDPSRFLPLTESDLRNPPREVRELDQLVQTMAAAALSDRDEERARKRAREAMVVRAHACRVAGEVACERDRGLELVEGSAEYVAGMALVPLPERLSRFPAPAALPFLSPTTPVTSSAARRGKLWFLLLDRFAPPGWHAAVDRTAPDLLLIEALGQPSTDAASILAAAFESPEWARARSLVTDRFLDSLLATSPVPLPIIVQVHFQGELPGPPALLQHPNGSVEQRYAFGRNVIVTAGTREIWRARLRAHVHVRGRTATVGGRIVHLDRAGEEATGPLALDSPELTLRLEHATLRVHADSLSITAW